MTDICLCMIVRNEAHIIQETLASVAGYITDYLVVDTGSDDDTPAVIASFFAERDIPGQVLHRPWRHFGHNRTQALDLAREHSRSEYLWMMDADDVLEGRPEFEGLGLDAYRMRLGPEPEYWRLQIFRRTAPWRYVGVLHEYPSCDDPQAKTGDIEGDCVVQSRRLGHRSRDPLKYQKDAELLEQALRQEPGNTRYAFYLAQSHYDAGDLERALEAYTRRAEMGGWEQEVFYSRW